MPLSSNNAFDKVLPSAIFEKSVGTRELHYSTKKREHSFSILKAFFRPQIKQFVHINLLPRR